jgi:hypothetical protein
MDRPDGLSVRAERRLVGAFAIVPLGIALVSFVGWWAILAWRPSVGDPVSAAWSVTLGITIIGLVVTVCGAVPGFIFLRRRGRLSLSSLVILGVVLGNVPLAVIMVGVLAANSHDGTFGWRTLSNASGGISGAVSLVLLGTAYGAASAATFWLIGVRGSGVARTPRR